MEEERRRSDIPKPLDQSSPSRLFEYECVERDARRRDDFRIVTDEGIEESLSPCGAPSDDLGGNGGIDALDS